MGSIKWQRLEGKESNQLLCTRSTGENTKAPSPAILASGGIQDRLLRPAQAMPSACFPGQDPSTRLLPLRGPGSKEPTRGRVARHANPGLGRKPGIARHHSRNEIQTARRDTGSRRRTEALSERWLRPHEFLRLPAPQLGGAGAGLGRGLVGFVAKGYLNRCSSYAVPSRGISGSRSSWSMPSRESSAPGITWRAKPVGLHIRITRGSFYKFQCPGRTPNQCNQALWKWGPSLNIF